MAQQVRNFPPQAVRGSLVVVAAPQVRLDGRPDQLSPGARIRDVHNHFVLPASLSGQTLAVHYTRESHGMLHELWLLTPAEAALSRAD